MTNIQEELAAAEETIFALKAEIAALKKRNLELEAENEKLRSGKPETTPRFGSQTRIKSRTER